MVGVVVYDDGVVCDDVVDGCFDGCGFGDGGVGCIGLVVWCDEVDVCCLGYGVVLWYGVVRVV